MARVYFNLAITLLIAGNLIPATAIAGPTDDAAAQSALATAQLERLKTLQSMLAPPPGVAEGKATLTTIESGAEVLQLRHKVEAQLATSLATDIGAGAGKPILLIFGSQPPTTAHYLSIRRGVIELERESKIAVEMARDVFKAKKPKLPQPGMYSKMVGIDGGIASTAGPLGVGLTAVSTLVSLLRVDTELKGAALASNAEALGPVVSRALTVNGWLVQAPSGIASATPYADKLIDDMRPLRDEAAKYYAIYVARLAAKEGKPDALPERERIVGQALATVMANHSALVSGLFVPVNGVLPATVIEEEKALAEASPDKSILYLQSHEAAMTSITKKGFLTGIIGVPAYVSASSVFSYTFLDGRGPRFGSVSYQTPVMRVTGVAKWVGSQPPPVVPPLAFETASAARASGN